MSGALDLPAPRAALAGRIDSPFARIDRTRRIAFAFAGHELHGHPGDTLASALLGAGVRVVGRSVYRDRPRGVLAAGVEEPNALVRLHDETGVAPLIAATEVELRDGLRAEPRAGVGRVGELPDRGRRDVTHRHCDVLVVGAGPAGLAAADAAAATGARVLLADRGLELGGSLLDGAAADGERVAGERDSGGRDAGGRGAGGADAWLAAVTARLAAAPDVVVLPRTAVLGLYDHGYALLAERRPDAAPGRARERLWRVRAGRVVLATGAVERPLVFAGNDRPGVMLAGAVRAYANRWAVAAGRAAVVFATHDGAYATAADLAARGIAVRALVDARDRPPEALASRVYESGIEVIAGSAVAATDGDADGAVRGVRVTALDGDGRPRGPVRAIDCDLLAVSGGWTPALELHAHAGGELRWDPARAAYLPGAGPEWIEVVGAAAGEVAEPAAPPRALWAVPPLPGEAWDDHFVDLQRDATVADVRRAVDAGLRSPEHVKRATTIGTGRDQGRTSHDNARGILAGLLGDELGALPAPRHRPPSTPVPFALLAGRERGDLHDPIRVTPLHAAHVALGARFEDVGQWKRAWFYPRDGEDLDAAVMREQVAVRTAVGAMDASTLGKIDVQGPDAGELLDRVYTNLMSTVPVGGCRYGVLCGVDGMVFDDGVVMRLADDRYITTTTTGNAAAVLDFLEEWVQTEWPDLRVHLTSVTDQWAAVAVAGPRAADLLAGLVPPAVRLDAPSFRFMTVREATVAGAPARLCRVSFSGELAFEVHVAARHGRAVWDAVIAAGAVPYGTETMHVLRAEKGYPIVGQDTDGTVTPQDLGMEWVVSKKKPFFVGRRSHRRADNVRGDRRQFVGLLPVDPGELLVEGAALLSAPDAARAEGHVTSSYRSAALGRTFALALLERGGARHGETVHATTAAGGAVAATVTGTVLYDPEGRRRDGE